jgi:hypothetical protein
MAVLLSKLRRMSRGSRALVIALVARDAIGIRHRYSTGGYDYAQEASPASDFRDRFEAGKSCACVLAAKFLVSLVTGSREGWTREPSPS